MKNCFYRRLLFIDAGPSNYPGDFKITSVEPTSITLSWTEVEGWGRNGPITAYLIKVYDYSQPLNEMRREAVDEGTFTHIVDDLQPDTLYGFRIAAINPAGTGVSSPMINRYTSRV